MEFFVLFRLGLRTQVYLATEQGLFRSISLPLPSWHWDY